jgi:hypothetical protein
MAVYVINDIGEIGDVLKKLVEGYEINVGVLEDYDHKNVKGGTAKKFHGTVGRRTGRKIGISGQELGGYLEDNYGWLDIPFQIDSNKEILDFAQVYIQSMDDIPSREARIKSLAMAIIRNPILRGDYGKKDNGGVRLVDTGQFFNSIKAELVKRGA